MISKAYSLSKLCLKIKSFLITLIYRKCLIINLNQLNKSHSIGQIVNFMSIDTDTLVNLFPSIHSFWSLPLQILITLYLLYVCSFILYELKRTNSFDNFPNHLQVHANWIFIYYWTDFCYCINTSQ